MKLLFFSSMAATPWGGSEELWAAAAGAALQAGHTVAVSVFDWPEPAAGVRRLREAGAVIMVRPHKASIIERLEIGRPAWLRDIDAFRPDVVCISQGTAYECAVRSATRAIVPWLLRTRTPMINIVQFNKRGVRSGARELARVRAFYEAAAKNLFVAARNIEEASAFLGSPTPRAEVVRNPVNLRDTSPLPWPRTEPARMAVVARLSCRPKGQDVLLRVLAGEPWRSRGWRLTIAGTGTDEGMLRDQCAAAGLTDRVSFAGQVSDIRSLWADHHLFVLPSEAEGTPLAMVEAMLLGRPVVVTDVGGCADWMGEGVEGWLAESAWHAHVDGALERAWAARSGWEQAGQAARARALAQWDPTPGRTVLAMLEQAAKR